MPFRFPLESLLRFRTGRERAERLKLEAIAAEQFRLRAWIQSLADASAEIRAAFQQRLAAGVSAAELRMEIARQANIVAACNSLQIRLAEAEQRRREQAEIFLRARRDREVLEELRRARLEQYRLRQARREQQELDDLFGARRAASSAARARPT